MKKQGIVSHSYKSNDLNNSNAKKVFTDKNWQENISCYYQKCLTEVKKQISKNKSAKDRNIPCAALLFSQTTGDVIDITTNQKHTKQDLFSHCETRLLQRWTKKHKSWRLKNNIALFSLLEPCYLCFFAILEARVKLLVYTLSNPRTNTLKNIQKIPYSLIAKTKVIKVEQNNEYSQIIKEFFTVLRTSEKYQKNRKVSQNKTTKHNN